MPVCRNLGCGPDDVSVLAAELVGPSGSVVGIDRSAVVVAVANERVLNSGLRNVDFRHAELHAFTSDVSFDCVVGRCVLIHQANPADFLRAGAASCRQGASSHSMSPTRRDPSSLLRPLCRAGMLSANWFEQPSSKFFLMMTWPTGWLSIFSTPGSRRHPCSRRYLSAAEIIRRFAGGQQNRFVAFNTSLSTWAFFRKLSRSRGLRTVSGMPQSRHAAGLKVPSRWGGGGGRTLGA